MPLLDPTLCTPWPHHNRDPVHLTHASCHELIDSIRRHGQRVPAILRPDPADPTRFQIIAGARRHFATTWLRTHYRPDYPLLATVIPLSDDEAFITSDLENRTRTDISDLERARDYAAALPRHFAGSQRDMARRLGLSEPTLSRYLVLAALDPLILAAYPSPHHVTITHTSQLAPWLNRPVPRQRILEAAADLAVERESRERAGLPLIQGAAILKRLLAAARPARHPRSPFHVVHRADGKVLAFANWYPDTFRIEIPRPPEPCAREEIAAAILQLLERTDFPRLPDAHNAIWTLREV